MNLSQLIVKLQIVGAKELEKVVKDLGKVGLFGGGGKSGVAGVATGKNSGPAEQSKLIKALGSEYERFSRILGGVNKTQSKEADEITKKLKTQLDLIEELEGKLKGTGNFQMMQNLKDQIDETKKSAKELGDELGKAGGSGGGGKFGAWAKGGTGGFMGGPLGIAGAVGGAAVALHGITSYVAQVRTNRLAYSAENAQTWGEMYRGARRGDFASQELMADSARYLASAEGKEAYNAKAHEYMQSRLLSVSNLNPANLVRTGIDFVQGTRGDETGEFAQQAKRIRFELAQQYRAANAEKYNALSGLSLSLPYERRVAGEKGSNKVSEYAKVLANRFALDEGLVTGLKESLIGVSGREAGGWEMGLGAISHGMSPGAVGSMLTAGPRGSKILAALYGRGLDVAAQEKIGSFASGIVGNPLMSMGNPGDLVSMLSAGLAGNASPEQNRMVLQNQAGIGSYGQMMTGVDAWGQTTSFINANNAASGLSLYAKRALAEIAKDPNKLAAIQAGTYQVSSGESALGLTDDMVRNFANAQGKTELSRFLQNDPGLAGTRAGDHLAGAARAGGFDKYLASVPEAQRGQVRAEMSTLMSMGYGGAEGVLATDEAAIGNLAVRTPGGKLVGGSGAGVVQEPSKALVQKENETSASLNDFNTAVKTATGTVDLWRGKLAEGLYGQASNPNPGFMPPFSVVLTPPPPRVAPPKK